ncbi:ammonium transporter [Rhodococcus sp. HM1]|uniref:ammonium transporter n=1 Tax=unclassified Rhodococcus (in: high G+C Gram-positive bacteria) TaxID=192944 RepID=UPI0018CD260A|nr:MULTISPECIES: ammonium transporter [unclassified Rhodococcus (in: high G+C Gram-positive bacteria)]MBH0118690.1 ammonium transporter [Rhodococcus sp. CX]MCK8671896.1 ammonium transporter [Rhodococcus sp. HM1]
MKLRKLAAVATMTIAAMGITAGTSYAAPAEAAQDEIHYEVKAEGDSVVTVIDAGAFKVSGDGESVELQDTDGNTVVSLPLAIQLGDLQLPFEREISEDGKTLTLTPVTDPSKATPVAPEDKVALGLTPVSLKLQDVASPDENLKAQNNFSSQLGIATAVGGLAGTIIGAVVGGLGFLGGPVGLASVPFGAGVGGVIGTIVVGGPALIIAGIGLLQTLAAPPGTTPYA